jgi:VanZ family protein
LNPRYALLTVLYCAGIFGLSSSSNPIHVESHFPGQDKVAHAVLYGGLATVVSVGIRRSGRNARPWTQFIAPLVFASMYGITDEMHQIYVPGRTPDTWDVLADVLGACIAQIVLCRCVWRLSMR